MNKEQIIEAVKNVDISDSNWLDLLDKIDDLYARGYMCRLTCELGNTFDSADEEYRERVLEALEYDIWGYGA